MSKTVLAAIALMGVTSTAAIAEEVSIRLGFGNASTAPMYEQIVEAFEKQHPDISVELVPHENYPALTQAILRGAVVNDVVDVAHPGWSSVRTLVDRGLPVALDDFIAGDAEWQGRGYPPSVTQMGAFGGATYAVPFWSSAPVLFYNAELVERAGGDPDDFPRTWPEIIELAKKIDALGPETSGLHYIYANTDWNFQSLVMSYGGSMMSSDEAEVAFNSEAGLKSLELLAAFHEIGMNALSRDQARQLFSSGTLGIIGGESNAGYARYAKTADGVFTLRLAQHPLPSDAALLPSGGNGMVILTKDEAKQKAAWEYAKFASGPIAQTILVERTGAVPINREAVERSDLLSGYYAERPDLRQLLEVVPNLTAWYAFPGPNAGKIVDTIERHVERVLTEDAAPNVILDDMARDVTALLP